MLYEVITDEGVEVAVAVDVGEGGYRLLSTDWNDYSKQIGHASYNFV